MTHQAVQESSASAIEALLYEAQDDIAQVLPGHISPDKMIAVALELVRGDSVLQRCLTSREGQVSILQGVLEASQLGLLLTRNLGYGYLIPFKHGGLSREKNQDVYLANFMIGYRGYVHLARTGNPNIAHILARLVFPGEPFDLDEGTSRNLYHKPNLEGGEIAIDQAGKMSGFEGAYALVVFKDGTPTDFEWMPLAEIQRCRDASRARQADTPWFQWPGEMAKKSVIRRLAKRLELNPELTSAFVRDEYREVVSPEQVEHVPAPRRMPMPRRRSDTVATTTPPAGADTPETPQIEGAPDCPVKGHGPMVLKPAGVSKKGRKYPAFFSCLKYPECKKNMKVEDYLARQREAAEKEQREKPSADPETEGKSPANLPLISRGEAQKLINTAGLAGWSTEDFHTVLGQYGYEKPEEIAQRDYPAILKQIETERSIQDA